MKRDKQFNCKLSQQAIELLKKLADKANQSQGAFIETMIEKAAAEAGIK